MNKGWN